MEANEPVVFIEGIDQRIKLDLEKHKEMLSSRKQDLLAYRQAVSHAVAKRKYYRKLIGGGKYDDDALRASMEDQRIDIRHLQDCAQAAQEAIDFETNIVDTLTQSLEDYEEQKKAYAAANRLIQSVD